MTKPHIELLSKGDIQAIHETSLKVLKDVGVVVTSPKILESLAEAGAIINKEKRTARFDENMVMRALETTGKKYILHGRNPNHVARYGYGDQNLISSPGQYSWFDHHTGERRQPTLQDTIAAATVGDALPNITIACGMSVPMDVHESIRDVVVTAQLVKTTSKPTWCWPSSRQSSRYILEIYKAVAGGKEALKQRPMVEVFLEPISPLQLADPSLTNVIEYIDHGQPVCVGPMASVTGTGPATLAGTLAQENAEILAGIVAVQAICPGTPMMYGGIPHLLDPRTASFVFSSPEQALMAVSMIEIGKHYGLPVYVNVNLSDSKSLDAQAGMEKLGTLVPAILAGADLFGHAGILGQDHGGSLLWLGLDNEAMDFAKRLLRGFQVNEDKLADSVIADIGPGGNYLTHPHTRSHFRQEQWFPSDLWTRQTYEAWEAGGELTITDRAIAKVDTILANHHPEPIDPLLDQEIDRIVEAAKGELLGA
jgi:trimethylamine---corrinoid protein Co-methyltransferase